MRLYKREVLNDVWARFALGLLMLMLSVDSLNPIKVVSRALRIPAWYWSFVALATMLHLVWHNVSEVVYRSTRVFLHSVLSISFKSIDVVGLDNVPTGGPVIFTGNHANQFIDGIVIATTTPRKVGFLIAEKSWHLPVVGPFARFLGCIPVVRPQDSVIPGVGLIKLDAPAAAALDQQEAQAQADADGNGGDSPSKKAAPKKPTYVVVGQDSKFTAQLTPGDQIRLQGKTVKDSGPPVKVVQVLSDTQLVVDKPLCDANKQPVQDFVVFGIFKRVDQAVTFAKVYRHLNRGNCIGIFPEGGSHDRTDLLPLKAGVAIMALGTRDKYKINVPVVPIGMNYFRPHRFRGRVTVEFGQPIFPDENIIKTYETDKRAACNAFLHRVEEGMRSVISTAPDYNTMQLVFTARRLFQRSGVRLTAKEKQDLNRRFTEGYKVLAPVPGAAEEMEVLRKKLDAYNKQLKLMGVQDHQVPFIAWWSIHDVIGSALYGFLIFALASIPSFVLNAPVGFLARYVANKEQKRALAGSTVKVAARDVVMSKKVAFSVVAVPALWIFYGILLAVFTNWYWSTIMMVEFSFPLFAFFGVRSVEAGIIELKTVRPLFYRLLPQHRRLQDELPLQRVQLQHEVRAFIKKYRAELGPLAENKEMDWHAYMHEHMDRPQKAIEGEDKEAASTDSTTHETEEIETRTAPAVTITSDHDLSFLRKSSQSVADLANMDRSMSCPPGFQEVLDQAMENAPPRAHATTE